MKKIILVAAIGAAALVAPAFAQDTLTLYGKMNVALQQDDTGVDGSDASLTATITPDTPSRWGIKGSENIAGLKVIFNYEAGIKTDTTYTRHAYAGVDTSAGKFLLGQTWTADFLVASYGIGYFIGDMPLEACGTDGCLRELGIHWRSPNWSGFTANVSYSGDTGNDGGLKTPFTALGLKYNAHNIIATLGYSTSTVTSETEASSSSVTTYATAAEAVAGTPALATVFTRSTETSNDADAKTTDNSVTFIRLGYKFAGSGWAVTPILGYEQATTGASVGDDLTQNHIGLGVRMGFGVHDVHLGFGQLENADNGGEVADSGGTSAMIEYNYKLSKRSTFAAGYSTIAYDKNHADNDNNGKDQTATKFLVGLGHNF